MKHTHFILKGRWSASTYCLSLARSHLNCPRTCFMKILPRWLMLVKGVVDSDDLPLNVTREILQKSKVLNIINNGLVRKSLDMIRDMVEDDFGTTSGECSLFLSWNICPLFLSFWQGQTFRKFGDGFIYLCTSFWGRVLITLCGISFCQSVKKTIFYTLNETRFSWGQAYVNQDMFWDWPRERKMEKTQLLTDLSKDWAFFNTLYVDVKTVMVAPI